MSSWRSPNLDHNKFNQLATQWSWLGSVVNFFLALVAIGISLYALRQVTQVKGFTELLESQAKSRRNETTQITSLSDQLETLNAQLEELSEVNSRLAQSNGTLSETQQILNEQTKKALRVDKGSDRVAAAKLYPIYRTLHMSLFLVYRKAFIIPENQNYAIELVRSIDLDLDRFLQSSQYLHSDTTYIKWRMFSEQTKFTLQSIEDARLGRSIQTVDRKGVSVVMRAEEVAASDLARFQGYARAFTESGFKDQDVEAIVHLYQDMERGFRRQTGRNLNGETVRFFQERDSLFGYDGLADTFVLKPLQ